MHIGIAYGLKKTREDIATVRTADMAYMDLPYCFDNPIFLKMFINYKK